MSGTLDAPGFVLTLYVAGPSPRSARAIETLQRVCHEQLADHVELRVIDIHQDPAAATRDQIVATPTLVKSLPAPVERFVGDLLAERLVVNVDVRAVDGPGAPT